MELPAATVEALFAIWPVARLASVRAGGAPHLVPVVFAPANGRLWIPIDAKPKRGGELLRVRNLRRRPEAALLLDHWDEDWRRLWWLRVDAEASVVEAPAGGGGGDALREATRALRRKYPQYTGTPLFRDAPRAIALAPHRVRSWCASAAAARGAAEAVGAAAAVRAGAGEEDA